MVVGFVRLGNAPNVGIVTDAAFKMSGAENLGFALQSEHAIPTINEITNAAINQTII